MNDDTKNQTEEDSTQQPLSTEELSEILIEIRY